VALAGEHVAPGAAVPHAGNGVHAARRRQCAITLRMRGTRLCR
jgi:hypothetical protein